MGTGWPEPVLWTLRAPSSALSELFHPVLAPGVGRLGLSVDSEVVRVKGGWGSMWLPAALLFLKAMILAFWLVAAGTAAAALAVGWLGM